MKKLFIETYGCQMNVADSEVIASVMKMAGYETCASIDEADAVLLNTCSVRENAENKIYNRLEALYALQKKAVLSSLVWWEVWPYGVGHLQQVPLDVQQLFAQVEGEIQNLVAIPLVLGRVPVCAHEVFKVTDAVFQIVQPLQKITAL